MEVGNGQFHENFPSGFHLNDFEDDDDDDDDGHFVIALDDSGVENDELDGGALDLTEHADSVNVECKGGEVSRENATVGNEMTYGVVSTLREPASSRLAQSLQETQPLSLRLECTTEDVKRQFESNSVNRLTEDNDSPNKAPEVPNFLTSSPDIIKRLQATLIDRTSTSQSSSKSNKSSSFLDGNYQGNSDSSHSSKVSSEAQRKLEFTPRTDCSCIMCYGWDPSKIQPVYSSQFESSNPLQKRHVIHQKLPSEPFISNPCGISSSGCNVSNSNAIQNHPDLKASSVSNGEKLKLDRHSIKTRAADDSKPSPSLINTNNDSIHQKNINLVLELMDSFAVLVPQPSQSSKGRIAYLKKNIPEINTKEGKVLILTSDFMNAYQPDLRPIVARSKKLDLSVPGTVCLLMRNDTTNSSLESAGNSKNSDYVLKIPTSQFSGQYSTTLSANLSKNGVNDALLNVVHSHFLTNNKANASNLNKTIKLTHTTKQITATQTSETTGKSQLSPTLSSPMKVSLLGTKTAPQPIESKTSIDPYKLTFSSLPPPPPLVRRPNVPITPESTCSSTQLLMCSSSTYAPFSVCISTTTSSAPHCSTKIINHVLSYAGPIISPSVSSNSVSDLPSIESSTEFRSSEESSLVKKHSGHTGVEEPREILVIPVVSKGKLHCRADQKTSILNTNELTNSAGLYTFTAPLEKSQEEVPCQSQEQTGLVNDCFVSCNESEDFEPTPLLYGQSEISEQLPEYQKSCSFSDYTNIVSVVATSLPDKIAIDPNSNKMTNQPPCNNSVFPTVVKVNLSSSANMNILYTDNHSPLTSCIAGPSDTNKSTVTVDSNSYIQKTSSKTSPLLSHLLAQNSSVGTCPLQSYQKYSVAYSSVSSNIPFSQSQSIKDKNDSNYITNITQSAISTISDSTFTSQSSLLPSSNFVPMTSSLNTSYISHSSMLSVPHHVGLITSSSSQTAPRVSSVSSSSFLTPSSLSILTSPDTQIFSSSSLSSSLHSALSSSGTLSSSSSSVSVNGLKMKIRLGDVKNNFEVGETRPENGLNNSKSHPVKRKTSSEQREALEEDITGQRKESAEEMFQRYQEQAMREVYNAQFGIGNLSRSLRPSRSNISFVDKSFHAFRADDSKKKKVDESSSKPKSTEEIKKSQSSTESQPIASENDNKRTTKVMKKRHSSCESRAEVQSKSPEYDINDFPRLREDTSILMTETIHTPNIMAGHKVFVKFNIFSNPQSCRTFLIPFFNLGGSRVQFDNEDMEYIKKAVVDVEKEERFCARHLIYYSREGSKASFLRKENLAQTNDLNDSSYKKWSYILEGFSRESVKRSEPLPEEWKVDKKVSIEIDTADVDSNVIIDFEESLSDAVVSASNEEGRSQKVCDNSNIQVEQKELNSMTNIGPDQTMVETGSCINSASQERQFECKTSKVNSLPKSCLSENDHSHHNSTHASNLNHLIEIKQTDVDHRDPLSNKSLLTSEECDIDCGKCSNSPKSSNFRPNILRKKSTILNSKSHNSNVYSANLLPSKTFPQESATVSAVNYTDQLKELFFSGNFHETFVYTGKENKDKGQYDHENNLVVSDTKRDFVPFKQETVDEEYEHSVLSRVECDASSSLHQNASTPSLSSGNLRIKPEPVDEYFESLERSETNSGPNALLDNKRSNSLSASEQPVSHMEPPMNTVNNNVKMNVDQEIMKNKTNLERDAEEETLSACSDSVPLSSNVSESSEISSSSCTDTSDEDISGGNDDWSSKSVTSLSFTSNVSESPGMLNANFSQNSVSTKITSLVESLKQRLSQNGRIDIPSVFPSSPIRSKMKHKKKKKKLNKEAICCNSIRDQCLTLDTSLGSNKPQSINSAIQNTADADISHTKCFLSSSLPSVSTAPENTDKLATISNKSTLLAPMPPEETNVTDNCFDVTEFRKRFPFITSGDANKSNRFDIMHNFHQVKEPDNTSNKEGLSCKTQDKDSLNSCVNTISRTPLVENSKSLQIKDYNDFGSDSESEIDVGFEEAIMNDLSPEARDSSVILSSSLLSDSNRNSNKAFTSENKFTMSKKTHLQQETVNPDIQPKKFMLPLRPRNKTKATKKKSSPTKPPDPPSAASLLCQKLDIPVESIVPQLKRKLLSPFEAESGIKNRETLPIHSVPELTPKPINPGFKPSINAIFGVPDIPKTLHTAINKTGLSKVAVAKKSSTKKSKGQVKRQVAKKGTTGTIKNQQNIKQQECVVLIENKVQPEIKSIIQDRKNGQNQDQSKKRVGKNNLGKKLKQSNDKNSSLKKIGANDKKDFLETKSNPNLTQKKLNTKKKSCLVNRKLGSLLIQVNRYSSLRKFAWRKYSGFREKTYIIETSGKDDIPAIIESDDFLAVGDHNNDSKYFCIEKNNVGKEEAKLDIKPCKLILHKLENMIWDANEVAVKSESGSYIIKHVNNQENQNKEPELMKKRKKKSVLKNRKKNSGKPRTKRDIVDFYAAAIESLRKKALLLEEDEKKKMEMESHDKPVIKQEIIESNDLAGNEEKREEEEDSLAMDSLSNISDVHIADSFVSNKSETDLEQENVSNKDDKQTHELLEMSPSLGLGSDVTPCAALYVQKSPDVPNSNTKLVETENRSLSIADAVVKTDHRKGVYVVERNYEGDMIQVSSICFQDQDDIEGMSSDEDSFVESNYADWEKNDLQNTESILPEEKEKPGEEENLLQDPGKETSKIMEENDKNARYCTEIRNDAFSYEKLDGTQSITRECESVVISENDSNTPEFANTNAEQMAQGGFEDEAVTDGLDKEQEFDHNSSKRKTQTKLTNITISYETKNHLTSTNECEKADSYQRCEAGFEECNRNIVKENETNPSDCSFIHKDIVLGFEDTLGADTALSKLVEDGEDDMFLLGDDEDDTENMGLIPDEEVERLLGLDVKDNESESSVVKPNEDAIEGNIHGVRLSWKLLPEDTAHIEDTEKVEAENNKTENQGTHGLIINTCSDVGKEKTPERENSKPAKVSPSWKRILGTQALKEIEESVSSAIATGNVEKDLTRPSREKKLIPNLHTDKLKLKLCTGALSKALKLSAEMRKTFGDGNDSNIPNKHKGDENAMNMIRERHKENGESFSDITQSVFDASPVIKSTEHQVKKSSRNLRHMTSDVRDMTHAIGHLENDNKRSIETQDNRNKPSSGTSEVNINTANKPFGNTKIDLAKLKMKLSPVLAATKAKSIEKKFVSNEEDIKRKIPSSFPLSIPEVKESTPSGGTLPLRQETDCHSNTANIAKTKPLLNTEKLANILKNFKKPANLNISISKPSCSSSSNLSSPSSGDAINNLHTKTQKVSEEKLPTRKRRQQFDHRDDKMIMSKRNKKSLIENNKTLKEKMEIDEDKGQRSCFDCLSELATSE